MLPPPPSSTRPYMLCRSPGLASSAGGRRGAMHTERRRPHAEGPRSSGPAPVAATVGPCAQDLPGPELASAVARAPCRSGSRRRPHGQVYVRLQQKQKKILCERIYQTLGKVTLPSVMVNTLGKVGRFAECRNADTRQRLKLCRVPVGRTLGTILKFAECFPSGTRQSLR